MIHKCLVSFPSYHFQGTRIKLSIDFKRANRGSHFFKAIVVVLFLFHRYVLNTVRNCLVLENIFSVHNIILGI